MEINEQIKAIKGELRLAMNGVASTRMREAGFAYKWNFGVELPRLQQIAQTLPSDHRLAQALWMEPIRECRILGAMLMPADDFTPDLAEVWVDQIDNIEMARLASMFLFVRLPYAVDISFRWIAGEHQWRQLCGLLVVMRLIMNGMQLSEHAMTELIDQAEALKDSDNSFVAQAAQMLLQRCD